jgi:hypothetical protein
LYPHKLSFQIKTDFNEKTIAKKKRTKEDDIASMFPPHWCDFLRPPLSIRARNSALLLGATGAAASALSPLAEPPAPPLEDPAEVVEAALNAPCIVPVPADRCGLARITFPACVVLRGCIDLGAIAVNFVIGFLLFCTDE